MKLRLGFPRHVYAILRQVTPFSAGCHLPPGHEPPSLISEGLLHSLSNEVLHPPQLLARFYSWPLCFGIRNVGRHSLERSRGPRNLALEENSTPKQSMN